MDRKGQAYDIPVNPDGTVPIEALEARSQMGHKNLSGWMKDLGRSNRTTYPINAPAEQILPWWKAPAKYDVEGIDALPGVNVKPVRRPKEKKSDGWTEPESFVDDPKTRKVVTFKEVKSNGKTYRLSATEVYDNELQKRIDCYANVKCQDTNEFFGPFPAKTLQDAKRVAANHISSKGSSTNVMRPAGVKKENKAKTSTPKKTEPVKAVPGQKKESDFLKEHIIIAAPAPVGYVPSQIQYRETINDYERRLFKEIEDYFGPALFTIYGFDEGMKRLNLDPNSDDDKKQIVALGKSGFLAYKPKAKQIADAFKARATAVENARKAKADKDAADMAAMRARVAARTPAEPVPVVPTQAKYYEISEDAARRAKEENSFDYYKEGSETASYKETVDEVVKVANAHKATIDPMYWPEVDKAVDRWCKWYANWTNRYNTVDASVPSVMIAGPANFPTKKKERQNASRHALWEEYRKYKDIEQKIRSIGTGGISSSDANARAKIEAKIVMMQDEHDSMVRINKAVRSGEGSKAFEALTDEEKQEARMRIRTNAGGYKTWQLTNNGAEIRRLKGRLDDLDHEEKIKAEGGTSFDTSRIDGLEIVEDSAEGRIKLLFDAKPSEAARSVLKHNGFRWSPKNNAWQCFLNDNGRRSVNRVLEQLPEDWRD